MKLYAADKIIKPNELKKAYKKMETALFLKYDKKHYQCAGCHTIFSRELKACPCCKSKALSYITKRRTNYWARGTIRVFRKEKDHVIELLFLAIDSQKNGFHRDIHLIRKTEYKDKVKILFNYNFGFNTQLRLFGHHWYYRPGWGSASPKHVRGYRLGYGCVTVNSHNLLNHYEFKYIFSNYSEEELNGLDNNQLEQALEYPRELEMLNKYSNRTNLYSNLKTIRRYKKTYLRYFNYFEDLGYIHARLLMKLDKVPETITFQTFKNLAKFNIIPRIIKTREQLEKYASLAAKVEMFDTHTYQDYLKMAADRGLDILSEDIYFNKNWLKDHDLWSAEAKYEKEKKKDKKFIKQYSKLSDKKYTINKHEIEIVKPKTIKDLFYESERLHHCVRTYSDRVINGECLILFVRENPEEPFITCEIRNNKIYQMRGKHNSIDMIEPFHKTAVRRFIQEHLVN